jgi:hypothetical protein
MRGQSLGMPADPDGPKSQNAGGRVGEAIVGVATAVPVA